MLSIDDYLELLPQRKVPIAVTPIILQTQRHYFQTENYGYPKEYYIGYARLLINLGGGE